LTEIKNHAMFMRAVARYKATRGLRSARGGRVRFVVVGDGHLRVALEEQARELGISEDVVFWGTRDDPENFYPALDIVALTSLNEGTPLTLIEAMANSRAVIATAVGGVRDLLGEPAAPPAAHESFAGEHSLEHESKTRPSAGSAALLCERGMRVPVNDEEAFCQGLARLVADADLRRELGESGRRFVEQQYSKERLLADVLRLYRELMPAASAAEASARRSPPEVHKQGERGVVSSEHKI
jgi:glycosyltransferase involved in cell wall biosynthesis